MRLWSLHPHYLDSKGLVALWRETLLAQKVLQGKTKGYRHHPQLIRFKKELNPLKTIGYYLQAIAAEAEKRGYQFNRALILQQEQKNKKITVTRGQIKYEFQHLLKKLQSRDPGRFKKLKKLTRIYSHPSLQIVPGDIASWEIV